MLHIFQIGQFTKFYVRWSLFSTCRFSVRGASRFARLASMLIDCSTCKVTPYIAGDFNCRPGDLNVVDFNSRYETNCDQYVNAYGRMYFMDICKVGKCLPINHMIYKGVKNPGDFTYFKAGKKSQIDYALTSFNGRKYITDFCIVKNDWHLSNHCPNHYR